MTGREKDALDDFWDIEKLIPEKKKSVNFTAHTYDTEPVEVILTAKESTGGKLSTIEMRPANDSENKLTFQSASKKQEPDYEYSPGNPFIKNVKIFKREDFGYYAAFYSDGIKYINEKGIKSEEPPFFSWVPQYSQLNSSQLNFYFYMRDCLRQKNIVNASYSYLLLYIFELINVESNKESALKLLFFVWKSYRKKFPKLDSLLREWIADFCLIHRLTPNINELGDDYLSAIENAVLKEIYICGSEKSPEDSRRALTLAMLRLCSNYDWRKSKFATEENIPLFKKFIFGSLKCVLSSETNIESVFVGVGELKRDAFAGGLCTPENKCRIEVSYCSISRSHEMRFLISDIIKHTENRIRGYLGIRSRLTVYSLPINIRALIDEYMDSELKGKKAPRKAEEPAEYEKLYDSPKREFSLENAKQIEERSWNTTRLLTEAFEEEQKPDISFGKENNFVENCSEVAATVIPYKEELHQTISKNEIISDEEMLISALSHYMDFVIAALNSDGYKQTESAEKRGRLADALADEINEIAAEVYGDIILEKEDGIYRVIEDYREVFENARDK